MKLFRHYTDLPAEARGTTVALGNFDGVHRGHRAVIAAAQAQAAALRVPATVLSFEPHPRSLFRPNDPPFRLTPLRIKTRLIEALQVSALFVLHFDLALSQMSAQAFVEQVLVQGLDVRHVVAGYDFVFGHGRTGNLDLLRRMGEQFGFGVTEIAPVGPSGGDDGRAYSSTRVRDFLRQGRPREAAAILGHPFEIEGRVEHGEKRGRTLGFPTANIELGDYLRPSFGVYAIRAGIDQGDATVWHDGVANLGRRPTVGGLTERLEAHLFDFDGDLYGQHLRVALIEFLRPEQRFDGLAALQAAIAADVQTARSVLAA